jgi:hypothetical protein
MSRHIKQVIKRMKKVDMEILGISKISAENIVISKYENGSILDLDINEPLRHLNPQYICHIASVSNSEEINGLQDKIINRIDLITEDGELIKLHIAKIVSVDSKTNFVAIEFNILA